MGKNREGKAKKTKNSRSEKAAKANKADKSSKNGKDFQASDFRPFTPLTQKVEEPPLTIEELSKLLTEQTQKIGEEIETFYSENLLSVESQLQVVLGLGNAISTDLRSMYSSSHSVWGDSFHRCVATGNSQEIFDFIKGNQAEKFLGPIKKNSQAFLHVFLQKILDFITPENENLCDWFLLTLSSIQNNKTDINKDIIANVASKCASLESPKWENVKTAANQIIQM